MKRITPARMKDVCEIACERAPEFIGQKGAKLSKTHLLNALKGRLAGRTCTDSCRNIQLLDFDWENGNRDRNWWWLQQALPFLNWYVDAYELLDEEGKQQGLDFSYAALIQWVEKADSNVNSPLAWHDHASAFRLRNLVRWITFISINQLCPDGMTELNEELIFCLVKKHVDFLLNEKNYTRHTNHGFDQMRALYTTALLWSNSGYLNYAGETAVDRLIDEIEFAFTKEGVHKENSPHYHKYMEGQLKQLLELEQLGDAKIYKRAGDLIEVAERFLRVVTLPDGNLPQIGDTEGGDLGIREKLSSKIEFYNYTDSDYFIAKGYTNDNKEFHLVFKCGHLSDYHRHDDDLSLHVYYNGEVILGDGGLGFYRESDPKRLFLRSPQSHSTVYPLGIKSIRKRERLSELPSLKLIGNSVIGESSAFGGRLRRSVDLSHIDEGRFLITDMWIKSPRSKKQEINFYFPECPVVENYTNHFVVTTKKSNRISFYSSVISPSFFTVTGWNEDAQEGVLSSSNYAEFDSATRAGWQIPISIAAPAITGIVIDSDPNGLTSGNANPIDALRNSDTLLNKMVLGGVGFWVGAGNDKDSLIIRSQEPRTIYIALGEEFIGFDQLTSFAHKTQSGGYEFTYNAISDSDATLYVIGYSEGTRIFTQRINCGISKKFVFPENVSHFRLFIRLAAGDEIDFRDIYWRVSDKLYSASKGLLL